MSPLRMLPIALFVLSCSKSDPPATTTPSATASAASNAPATPARDGNHPIFHPEKATEKAPDSFKVKFATTKGDFVVEVHREWAPNGADRFYNLVKLGYFDGVKFFRAVEDFMVQFGINGDPHVNGAWIRAKIPDDPVKTGNKRGMVTFATSGKDSRVTQVFVNYKDNTSLDKMGFAAFGEVTTGMSVVDSLYKGYGEGAPRGQGPEQGKVQSEGNAYLDKEFPKLDAVKEAKIE